MKYICKINNYNKIILYIIYIQYIYIYNDIYGYQNKKIKIKYIYIW